MCPDKNDFAVSGIRASSRNYRGLPPSAETPRMTGFSCTYEATCHARDTRLNSADDKNAAVGVRCDGMLGVISHERNQVCLKHSHNEDTSHDGRNSKGQRFRFHENEATQEGWYCREDSCPVCRYLFPARLTIDRAPRTECGFLQKAHGSTIAVRTFNHRRDSWLARRWRPDRTN